MPFTFTPSTGRYTDDAGNLVSDADVRAEIDALADAASGRLAALTERLRRGDLKLADWQREAMATIKESHVAAGVVAQGGRGQMTQSAYGFLGSEIRAQYAYLRDLANGIGDGSTAIDGRLVARAGLYGQHARSTYGAVVARQRQAAGAVRERNVLGSGESCDGCRAESARGWVEIGMLSRPGSRDCMANCRCHLEYSMLAEVAA
jgi:hypothetical protein